jgi:cytochrome c oxidase assembly factor CtaG
VADTVRIALDSLNAVMPAAAYVALVRRVRRNGGEWRAARTAAFVAAFVLAAVATSSVADDAARRSLAWHMTGQMALLLVVPPAIVAGRPLVLAGRALGRRSPPLVPPPAVAWIAFVGIQWLVHVPPVFAFALREPAAYAAMHLLLVLAGVAFFAQAGSGRLHPLALALYVAAAMPTTDAIGLWLLLDPHVIYPHYAGPGALGDQQAAGAIMFGAGNVLLLAAAWIAGRYLWEGFTPPSEPPHGDTSPPGTADRHSPAGAGP